MGQGTYYVGTWMVAVTRDVVWGDRTEAGTGVPWSMARTLVEQKGEDVVGSGGLLWLEEDRLRLGVRPPWGLSGAENPLWPQ